MSLSRNDPDEYARQMDRVMADDMKTSATPAVFVTVQTVEQRYASAANLELSLLENYNALQAYVLCKNAADVIDRTLERLKDHAITKAVKDEPVFGAEITTHRVVEYEYDDYRLDEINRQIDELKKRAGERRKLLRAIKEEVANTETGEIMKPAKLVRDGVTIAVKLPK